MQWQGNCQLKHLRRWLASIEPRKLASIISAHQRHIYIYSKTCRPCPKNKTASPMVFFYEMGGTPTQSLRSVKGDLRAGVLFGVACASGYARTIPTRCGQWPAGNLLVQVCLREKYHGWIGYHEHVDLHSLTRNGTFSPSYAV